MAHIKSDEGKTYKGPASKLSTWGGQQPKPADKPSKNAAKDLKAELESDDFGMTEKGGNGRVKTHSDGTMSVYQSYYYGHDDAMNTLKKYWSPGGSGEKYFADKGYKIEVVGQHSEEKSSVFKPSGKTHSGHVALTLKVTKP